jgi:hypothetical protein
MSGSIDGAALKQNEAWHVSGAPDGPAFGVLWANTSSLDIYERTSFRKDQFGVVHLRGVAHTAANAVGSAMFTLPAGYRPLKHRMFSVASSDGGGAIDVESTGIVWVYSITDDRNVSLDGVSFVAGE